MRHLRNVLLYFTICCFALVTACHSDEADPQPKPEPEPPPKIDPQPEVILTLTVDAAYVGIHSTDSWIFANDETGELLDIKSYTSGQTVTLSTTKKVDKFTLTFLDVSTMYRMKTFATFVAVPKGTTLKFLPEATLRTDGQNVTFHLSNYPYGQPVWDVRFTSGYGYGTSGNDNGDGTWDIETQIFDAPVDFLIAGYRDDLPVYRWEKGVKANDQIALDYNTLEVYPKLIKLDAPGKNNGVIWGVKSNKSYYLCDTYWGEPGHQNDTPTLGYLEDFDYYSQQVINNKDNGQVTYYKAGALNLSVDIPTYTFALHNREIGKWSADFSLDYTSATVSWTYQEANQGNYVSWNVTAPPAQAIVVPAIPPAIATKYPEITLDKFSYEQSLYTKYLDGRTYTDLIRGAQPAKNQTFYEYYIISPVQP